MEITKVEKHKLGEGGFRVIKMKKEIKIGVILFVALSVLIVPLIVSCAPKPPAEPGELQTLKIASTGPYSGPWAAIAPQLEAGCEDYIRYVNDNELIPGVKFEIVTGDTGYNPAQSLSLYERFKAEGIIFFHTVTSTDAESLTKFLAEDKVTGLCSSVSPPMVSPPGWWFAPFAVYEDAFGGFCKWVSEELWDWKGEGRAPRIAAIGFDNPMGRAPKASQDYVVKNYKVDYDLDVIIPIGVADTTAEMARIKEAEIDYVFMTAGIPEIMVMLKDATKLGLRDTITFTISHGQSGFYSIWEKMPQLIAGVYLPAMYSYIYEDLPGTNMARELQNSYHPDVIQTDTPYFMSFMPLMVGIEGVKMAVDKVGVENLTSADVKAALESGKVIDTGGIVPPLRWNKESRITHDIKIYLMTPEGEVTRVEDWMEVPMITGIK